MNIKIVMISSCIFLGALGITFTFIPDEIISGLSATPNPISILSLQLLGALYLGFTMLNWMAKGSLIGGIYNRPIAIGNFMHFAVGALALIKIITKIHTHSEIVISLTVAYSVFAILFGYVLITNPSRIEKKA
ncbi:hypothetical protein [Marivirga harenae]|uniref:hypothetical protein n=1 Tax=Marivirga harenae TaxID=2010992 RepID=UPI0026DFF8AE|nr:hypothetical protein [Marivirga harenae]WKV10606.1 hypothetical protein Q3Y49_10305 [Marivirga harenae]